MADGGNLGDETEAAVAKLVEARHYGSREEVLREGVRLVEAETDRLVRFEVEIMKGIIDAENGDSEDAEIVFARLRAKYLAMATKAA